MRTWMLTGADRMKKRLTRWAMLVVMCASVCTLASCIEPELHLPADDVVVDMPIVIMDMEVVWNVDVNWNTQWLYGWDAIDEQLSGSIGYTTPTNYEVRRYYLGDKPHGAHTHEGMDGFTVFSSSFRRAYNYGYYDLLLWSNIDSPSGTQVLLIDDSRVDEVTASTTATRGLLTDASAQTVTGLYNQPEIFYSAYERDIHISQQAEDYDYFDEDKKVWVKHIETKLTPLVYIYLVQVVLHHNDGRIVGLTGDAAVSAMASGTSVNTGHTNNRPCMVYFLMRMKQGVDYQGERVDVMGGKLTTFGLCDMEGWTAESRAGYSGSRTDLDNRLYLTFRFSNGKEKTYDYLITDQCRERSHGGVITLHLDARDIDPPASGDSEARDLFIPTLEDYENVDYDIPI